ncbi:pilus assembly protein TadG-related protein [Cryptosporangium aurantiacum]|uniref:Putative Flp pilus-assembly TadE/G-like n=1 Tax=Cryptosporangium aurantiacum TaxID=134849 RepID=A0A1M7RNR6_9ACTN|nr:pilus assembly protein TadG-related protein [Cryptosporangium aurantiacum]SHN47790.1 Putative Flp pilus-assembly TadE/G-like [Cryptosporangium aurantiacum]
MKPAMRRAASARRDAGSTLPLILLCVAIALLLIAGATTASSAFLAQRDLQAWCDSAALAVAGGAADAGAYTTGPVPSDQAPLHYDDAAAELQVYLAGIQNEGVFVELGVQNDQITLVCTRTVVLPFGRLFGIPDGLERVAVSSSRVRWRA